MSSLQISKEIMDLLNDAIKFDSESDGSVDMKLDIYQKYVKCVKEIFNILDEDLRSYSSENNVENLKIIRLNHSSILTTMQNFVNRLIIQISDDNPLQRTNHPQILVTEKSVEERPIQLRSLPAMSSIDILIAEKQAMHTTYGKYNIQKSVNAINALLKSDKLSVTERASIQLRLSRQIEENLRIARRREDELYKVNTDSLEQLYTKIDDDILNYKILKDNPELHSLYRSSQLFHHQLLKGSRTYSLVQSHHSPESSCLSFILKMSNVHPVVSFIDKNVDKLLNIKNKDQFFDEIKVFKENIEKLSKLCCLIINSGLSNPVRNASPKLLNILFEFIFRNVKLGSFIYKFLFEIYDEDLKNYNSNVKFIEDTCSYETLLPDKFKVQPDVISIIDKQVIEFETLRKILNPLEKIDMLSKIVTDLMFKIQDAKCELEIGADELIPILVYMIIRFNSAELFLHGKYLEHLLPDSYLIGIEGYMLVSMICAITFCVSGNFPAHFAKA